jgi:AbrB family looped-hinge helix DNA binding protein
MMQRRARITSKGQITIPRDIRRLLGVQAGDAVLFEEGKTGMQIRPARKASPFEKYRGIGNPGIASGRKAIVKHVRALRDGE